MVIYTFLLAYGTIKCVCIHAVTIGQRTSILRFRKLFGCDGFAKDANWRYVPLQTDCIFLFVFLTPLMLLAVVNCYANQIRSDQICYVIMVIHLPIGEMWS